jgi:O-antigen/teichoic acid export membrane protein
MAGPSTATKPTLGRRVAGQGALLMSGFAAGQAMAFMRNAMLGHMLAKGDFGVAAILTLLLQLLDALTDLGVDRLIVQAPDGDHPRFVATGHTALVVRGALIAAILVTAAPAIAGFFAVPEATPAILAIGVVPLIKGFQHLDARRAQRHLDNRPFVLIEIVPQAVALALTWPVVHAFPDFHAVVWLSLAQAVATLVISHAVAERRYALAVDPAILRRLVDFGWPIWLSAIPLIAVYQGDRILVGRFIGIEELAGYSAAFLVAMVPGLIAAKAGQSLMLPLFASAREDRDLLARRFMAMTEATTVLAACYLVTAMLFGGLILQIAFGPSYSGLGPVMAWLAAMWSMRMLQAVPGMVLLSAGETKPLLVAGLIRAAAIIPAAFVAVWGWGIEAVAAMGFVGELATLAYVAGVLDRHVPGLSALFAQRAALLIPAAGVAGAGLLATPATALAPRAVALVVTLTVVVAAAGALMPLARSRMRGLIRA